MNKNNLNVGDGKGEAMKIKRKPPQEMMKGGIRDRPLASWIRILGWFLSSQNFFTFYCSVVAVLWWTFIIAFMAGCYALMSVDLCLYLDLGMKCPQSGTWSSTVLRRTRRRPTLWGTPTSTPTSCPSLASRSTAWVPPWSWCWRKIWFWLQAEKSCTVSLNRIVGWTPEVLMLTPISWCWLFPSSPGTQSQTVQLRRCMMTGPWTWRLGCWSNPYLSLLFSQAQLKVVGRSENDAKYVDVVVTCYGADKEDAELLKGGKSALLWLLTARWLMTIGRDDARQGRIPQGGFSVDWGGQNQGGWSQVQWIYIGQTAQNYIWKALVDNWKPSGSWPLTSPRLLRSEAARRRLWSSSARRGPRTSTRSAATLTRWPKNNSPKTRSSWHMTLWHILLTESSQWRRRLHGVLQGASNNLFQTKVPSNWLPWKMKTSHA